MSPIWRTSGVRRLPVARGLQADGLPPTGRGNGHGDLSLIP